MIDFERFQDGVVALVNLDYGVRLALVSDMVAGERVWQLDEIEYDPAVNFVTTSAPRLSGNLIVPPESDLHREIDTAFVDWCQRESQEAHDAAPA